MNQIAYKKGMTQFDLVSLLHQESKACNEDEEKELCISFAESISNMLEDNRGEWVFDAC